MRNEIPTILIVDDVQINVMLLKKLLSADYQVYIAMNGQEALKLAEQHTPDLVLLDIMMPEMDGFEVFRRLRMIESLQNVPVIFVTALEGESDETRGLELGAADYITKPFRPEIVKLRVRNHLELKRQRDLLENLSFMDGLTGVPNRRRFDEYLEHEWKRAVRAGTMLSLVMIDIDYFKNYNDTYGHSAGDECLKSIARALSNELKRPADLTARFGGEEFGCILPETDTAAASHLAEVLREKIELLKIPHKSSAVSPYTTISVGVASVDPSSVMSPGAIVDKADAALYAAKVGGRNRVCTDHDTCCRIPGSEG